MLAMWKTWPFCQRPSVPCKRKDLFQMFSDGHFATVCKTRGDPRFRSGVRYMQEVEVEEDEDEYVFAVADEERGQGKVTVNIGSGSDY